MSLTDRHPPSPLVNEDEKRRNILDKGKEWAEDVNAVNAWHRLVLSLDGGGIRGYSSLLILEALMLRVAAWEEKLNNRKIDINDLLPCHYFDYMWGTSTGGLIAIMLGRLRMSVPQALQVYRDVGQLIFGKQQRRMLGGFNIVATRYNHANVKETVKKITREHCKVHGPGDCAADDTLLWQDMTEYGVENGWDLCQAVCITARALGKNSQALPLRTYNYVHDPILPSRDPNFGVQDLDLLIWEAARATSAAPFYFKMFEKQEPQTGRRRRYKDGGTLLNNPAEKALNEVRDRYGLVDGERQDPALLLSVGTGLRHDTPFAQIKNGKWAQDKRADVPFLPSIRERLAVAKHILVRYTDGEVIHHNIRNQVGKEHTWYKRLNVDEGLGTMDLGDWRKGTWTDPVTGESQHRSGGTTLTEIEKATEHYLTRTKLHTQDEIEWYLLPGEQLEYMAERLVRHRTERRKLINTEVDRVKWQTYQGRWATGKLMEPWDNDSYDRPYALTKHRETHTATTTTASDTVSKSTSTPESHK